jgi:hypothetical protein
VARAGWHTTEDLLAVIAELIDRSFRQYVLVESGGKSRPEPLRIPRPGREAPRYREIGKRQFTQLLRQLGGRRR